MIIKTRLSFIIEPMKPLLTALIFFKCIFCYSTEELLLLDQHLELKGDTVLEYSFMLAEGDVIVLDISEKGRSKLAGISFSRYDGTSLFERKNFREIIGRELAIVETSAYVVKIVNSSKSKRRVQIKMIRLVAPNSPIKSTSVDWTVQRDTVWSFSKRKILVPDTTPVLLNTSNNKVSSITAINGNSSRTLIDFELPEGTVAWSYFIGTNEEGARAFSSAVQGFADNGGALLMKLPGYAPLIALAAYGYSAINQLYGSDNVKYWIVDSWEQAKAFKEGEYFYWIKQGDVVADAYRMNGPLIGKVYICLKNDNVMQSIEVHFNATALTVKFHEEEITEKTFYVQERMVPRIE
jgi:hypothetical protein